MGNVCYKRFQKEIKLLVVGLDDAGKTTILYKLKLGEVIRALPTLGFNVETITFQDINFTIWDISAKEKIRRMWTSGHYYQGIGALIFVVDSNDRERMEECKDELWRFLGEEKLKDCPFLVTANKQDLPNALSVQEITEKLELNSIRDRQWYIEGTCATRGDGLYEGLDWLSTTLTKLKVKKTVDKEPFVKDTAKSGGWWTTVYRRFRRTS